METAAPAAATVAEVVAPAPAVIPPVADPAEPPKPERTFSQAELDEIVEKRLAKERRKREELNTRLRVTEELALRRADSEKEAKPKPEASGEPTRDQYASYEEFIEARADWRADQKVEKKFQERDAKDRERSAQSEHEKQRDAFRKSMKESAKDIADFDEVMGEIKATDPVGNISATAIEAAEAPGKVLYHLAKNPDEAERIASLSPGKQAREIVRLEEKLAKPPVKPSKAPDPITPVGGKAAVGDEMPNAATQPEKWLKWREDQVRAQRKGTRAS